MDALVQGMEVPPKGGLFPQQDDIAWCDTAVCFHTHLKIEDAQEEFDRCLEA